MIRVTSLLLGAALALVSSTAFAKPNKPKPPKPSSVEGVISAVTAPATTTPGQVTIAGATLNVVAGTRIEVSDHAGTFADLQVGQSAEAQFDPATLNATKIEVKSAPVGGQDVKVTGTVASATSTSLTLNLAGGGTVTLNVTPDTKIQVGDTRLAAGDLGALTGQQVTVDYNSSTFLAKEIDAAGNLLYTVTGTVTAVGGNSITVQLGDGSVRTFTVSPNALIRIGSTTGTLADVLVGDNVTVTGLGTGVNATALRIQDNIQPQHVEGTLTAVSGSTLTVLRSDGTSVTLTVAPGTVLRLGGQTVTLAQLSTALTNATAAGQTIRVNAEYVSRGGVNTATHVDASTVTPRPVISTVTGTVTAVDTMARTITLQLSNGTTQTFTLAPNATIRIGDQNVTLGDIMVGDVVTLTVQTVGTTSTVTRVQENVQRLNVDGVLTAVSGNTLTLTLRNGTTVTLTVSPTTDLRVNGKRVTVAQLGTLLTGSTQAIKVSAQYVSRGGVNTAIQIRANAQGKGFGK